MIKTSVTEWTLSVKELKENYAGRNGYLEKFELRSMLRSKDEAAEEEMLLI